MIGRMWPDVAISRKVGAQPVGGGGGGGGGGGQRQGLTEIFESEQPSFDKRLQVIS